MCGISRQGKELVFGGGVAMSSDATKLARRVLMMLRCGCGETQADARFDPDSKRAARKKVFMAVDCNCVASQDEKEMRTLG